MTIYQLKNLLVLIHLFEQYIENPKSSLYEQMKGIVMKMKFIVSLELRKEMEKKEHERAQKKKKS